MEDRSEKKLLQIGRRLPADVRLRRLRYDAARAVAWRALLSEEERARLDGYGVEKRQREFLLGRVVARQLAGAVREQAPHAVPLSVAEDGAVEVGGGKANRLRLSISHADDEAAAVVARRPVGVDLERVAPRPERLHRFLLSKKERPLLNRLPMQETAAFVLCWVLKEATLKALRCGLRRSPKILRLADVQVETGTARIETNQGRLFRTQFARDGDRWLAVAYEASPES